MAKTLPDHHISAKENLCKVEPDAFEHWETAAAEMQMTVTAVSHNTKAAHSHIDISLSVPPNQQLLRGEKVNHLNHLIANNTSIPCPYESVVAVAVGGSVFVAHQPS